MRDGVTKQIYKPLNLPEAVLTQMTAQKMLRGVRRMGLAVSGGADSVALVHLLLPICRTMGIQVQVLHLNHGLRGRASDADQRFVQKLAEAYGAACTIDRAPPRVKKTTPNADAEKVTQSLEMWARTARLAFFRRCAAELQLDVIATAHHADDVAETLLLRLARGAGMAGLAGIKPRSVLRASNAAPPLTLIRPLLACTRTELRAWLNHHGYVWREDSSNRDTAISRNHLRQVVLPWLEKHWLAALRRQLLRSAEILRAEDEWLNTQAETALAAITGPRGTLRRTALTRLPLALQRRAVRLWLIAQGRSGDAVGFDAVAQFLQYGPPRKQAPKIKPKRPLSNTPVALPVPGSIIVAGMRVSTQLAPGIVRRTGPIGCLPAACSLNPAALAGRPLELRGRHPGDRIAPLGLNGSRKVQDILIDAKVPATIRDTIPLLVCGHEIVWLPGYRVARAFAVRDHDAPAVQVRFAALRPT